MTNTKNVCAHDYGITGNLIEIHRAEIRAEVKVDVPNCKYAVIVNALLKILMNDLFEKF